MSNQSFEERVLNILDSQSEAIKLTVERLDGIESRIEVIQSEINENAKLLITVRNLLDAIDERTVSIEDRMSNMEERFDVVEQNISRIHRNIEQVWKKLKLPDRSRLGEVTRAAAPAM